MCHRLIFRFITPSDFGFMFMLCFVSVRGYRFIEILCNWISWVKWITLNFNTNNACRRLLLSIHLIFMDVGIIYLFEFDHAIIGSAVVWWEIYFICICKVNWIRLLAVVIRNTNILCDYGVFPLFNYWLCVNIIESKYYCIR